MNALTRWNPLRELEDFQNRILSAFRPAPARGSDERESLTGAEWTPLVNIAEDDAGYLITAELPEVRKDDVKVTVENGVLAISGSRTMGKEEKTKKYHLVERSYGTFSRSFALPGDGDPGKVEAQFKDGLLRIHVAKSETARPKEIEVKAA